MQYVKYNRINTEEFPNDYQGPGAIVIDAGGEFTPTGWFTADKTLFGIFGDDDFDKIPSEYSPSQYTPQGVVDEMNGLYGDYYSLDTDDFTILSIRPIN